MNCLAVLPPRGDFDKLSEIVSTSYDRFFVDSSGFSCQFFNFKDDSQADSGYLQRKRNHYSEETIYPIVHLADFNPDLFPKISNLIRHNNEDYPWLLFR